MLNLNIEKLKSRFERQFENNLYDIIFVRNEKTFEKTNIEYCLTPTVDDLRVLVDAPIAEEIVERNFIVKLSKYITKYFEENLYARDASFVNNYDGKDNHCISYFHFYIRDNMLSLNVYVRSMNFEQNFIYDNQTFIISYFEAYNEIIKICPKCEVGYIKVNIFSLHKKY